MIEQTELVISKWEYYPPANSIEGKPEKLSSSVGLDVMKKRAKTKKGLDYNVRLAAPVDISYNPATGQLDGTFPFEITYDGKTARVSGRSTTESSNSPLGNIKGKRASGIFGVQHSDFTFVSTNDFQAPGGAPLKLVCEEEYSLTPGK